MTLVRPESYDLAFLVTDDSVEVTGPPKMLGIEVDGAIIMDPMADLDEGPAPITSIGDNAFRNSRISALSFKPNSRVTRFGRNLFCHTPLCELTLPESLEELDPTVFHLTDHLTTVTSASPKFDVVDGILYDQMKLLFCPRDRARRYTIPASVTCVGAYAFENCVNIPAIGFSVGARLTTIEAGAFAGTSITMITIPPDVTTLGVGFLEGCSQLTAVSFQGTQISELPDRAFSGTGLNQILLPMSIKSIGACCFKRTRLLSYVNFEPNSLLEEIKAEAFWATQIEEFTIPHNLTKLDPSVFFETRTLTTIKSESPHFKVVNRALFDAASTVLIVADRSVSDFEVPHTVKKIGAYAFYQCDRLNRISFEARSQLAEIGNAAFAWCGFSSIAIPPTVLSLGIECFAHCTRLETFAVVGLARLKTIGYRAFAHTNLRQFVGPSSLQSVGALAFASSSLVNARFPVDVRELKRGTFRDCLALEGVDIWARTVRIAPGAFEGVSENATLYLPQGGECVSPRGFYMRVVSDGTRGFEVSEPPAPADTTMDLLLLDPAHRMRDPTFKGVLAGGFGTVRKLVKESTGEVSAAKELGMAARPDHCMAEVEWLRRLRHPCVLGLVGYYQQVDKDGIPFTVVTEWLSKGSLDTLIYTEKYARFPVAMKVKIVVGIVLGLKYIHACGVTHRDIKPQNILLTSDYEPKIGDLGSAYLSKPECTVTSNVFSPGYTDPGANLKEAETSQDVFSFGIMLWEIMTGRKAFQDEIAKMGRAVNMMALALKIKEGMRPKLDQVQTKEARDLIADCWKTCPNDRPTFALVFQRLRDIRYQLFPAVELRQINHFVERIELFEEKNPPRTLTAHD
jgi:hypothetical protein